MGLWQGTRWSDDKDFILRQLSHERSVPISRRRLTGELAADPMLIVV